MIKVTVYWYDSGKHLQEYVGASGVKVHDGALFIDDEKGMTDLILAPGDWHEVTFDREQVPDE